MGEGRGEGKTTAPLSDGLNAVPDNRLKTYNGTTYYYDDLGNLIHRELADGEVQNYFYDLHDQLVKAEIFKKDGTKETWAYSYDALGRRIAEKRRSFRRPRRRNRIRLGRQPPLTESPTGRQVYLYLHRSGFLRTAGTSTQPHQCRRRKQTRNLLLPLRPNRHPERDDR